MYGARNTGTGKLTLARLPVIIQNRILMTNLLQRMIDNPSAIFLLKMRENIGNYDIFGMKKNIIKWDAIIL